MTQSELAAALLRRRQTRENLKRYVHTRSFNRLAGRATVPGCGKVRSKVPAQVLFGLVSALFFLTGLYFLIF